MRLVELYMIEAVKTGSVWRLATQNWLEKFLDNGGVIDHGDRFISLSYDDDAGGQDNFGGKEVLIEFDEDEVLKQLSQQGLEPIEYSPEWFEEYPEIAQYVTGYSSEKDYIEDHEDEFDIPWESYIEDFSFERELVLKKLKYTSKLIKQVIINKPAKQSLLNKLRRNKIKVITKTGLENDPQLKLEI